LRRASWNLAALPRNDELLIVVNMPRVKISTKHHVGVPSEARRKLGVKAGDRLDVEVDRDVIHRRRHVQAGDRLHGIGAHLADGSDPAERIRAMRDADETRWVERQIEIDAELRAAFAAERDRG
jgi:AbrB family looped-hinge helix DNA binding protein